jgi:hypothetical protein
MSNELQQTEMTMRLLADFVNAILNGVGGAANECFIIMTCRSGQPQGGDVNCISNAQRDEVITTLKEFIARQEGRFIQEGGNA